MKTLGNADTAVVIVNWNGRHLLEDCLPSLRKQAYIRFSVIVVDNGSTDDSVQFMEKNFPEVTVIAAGKNLGFTGGNNLGICHAFGSASIKYIATLNNDTVVGWDWLSSLVKVMKADTSIGSCSSKVLYQRDRNRIDTAGIVVYRDGHAMSRANGQPAQACSAQEEVFGSSAVAALWRRSALEKTGLFDSMFFMYQEEVDLAWRLRYAGYRAMFVPQAVVYHTHSASSKPFSPLKAYYSERNRIWLVFKNFHYVHVIPSIWHALQRYRALAQGAKQGKGAAGKFLEKASFSSMAWVLVRAWAAGLLWLPVFIPKRISIQLMRFRNRISRKKINRWFKQFGVAAEQIALLR